MNFPFYFIIIFFGESGYGGYGGYNFSAKAVITFLRKRLYPIGHGGGTEVVGNTIPPPMSFFFNFLRKVKRMFASRDLFFNNYRVPASPDFYVINNIEQRSWEELTIFINKKILYHARVRLIGGSPILLRVCII